MTIYERIKSVSFSSVLNAPISIMLATKIVDLVVAYIKKEYLTSEVSSNTVTSDSHHNEHQECSEHVIIQGAAPPEDDDA